MIKEIFYLQLPFLSFWKFTSVLIVAQIAHRYFRLVQIWTDDGTNQRVKRISVVALPHGCRLRVFRALFYFHHIFPKSIRKMLNGPRVGKRCNGTIMR